MTATTIQTSEPKAGWRLFKRPRRLLGWLSMGLIGGAALLLPSGAAALAPACLLGGSLLASGWLASRLAPAAPLKAQLAALGTTTAFLLLAQATGWLYGFWSLFKTGPLLDLLTKGAVASGMAPPGWTPDFLFMESVNALTLVLFPLLVRLAAEGFARAPLFSGEERRPRLFEDPAFADAAGWSALISSLGLAGFFVMGQSGSGAGADFWLSHLQGFPWALALAPGLYFGFALQREEAERPLPERRAPEPPASVRQLYEELRSEVDLRPHLALALWSPGAWAESAAARPLRRAEDAAALSSGAVVRRLGGIDAEFLRMLGEAAEALRARGEATLVLCPDGAGAPLVEHLRRDPPSPSLRAALWRGGEATPDPFLDLAVVEEGALFESLEAEGLPALAALTRRMGLFVALELHALDASRLLLLLKRLEAAAPRAAEIGFLIQSAERAGQEGLISRLRARLSTRGWESREAATRPEAVAGGAVWLQGSEALRGALARFAGFPQLEARRPAEAYLALADWRAPGAAEGFAVHFLRSPGEPSPIAGLQADLDLLPAARGRADLRRHEVGSTAISAFPPRVRAISDRGTPLDLWAPGAAFEGGIPDQLQILVSAGYPGRGWMLSRLKAWTEGKGPRPFPPLAEDPGAGPPEIAALLAAGLSRPEGLTRLEAERILDLASVDLRAGLGISAEAEGLEAFLRVCCESPAPGLRLEAGPEGPVFRWAGEAGRLLERRLPALRAEAGRSLARLSAADEGLLLRPGADPAPGGAAREEGAAAFAPPSLFERVYALSAEPGEVLIESRAPSGRWGAALTLQCLHVHAAVERLSTGFLSPSPDLEPEALAAGGEEAQSLEPPIRRRRPFRSLALLRFEDPEGRHAGDAVLRATLAASLQTVLGLAFPAQARRLAVFSLDAPPQESRGFAPAFSCLHPQGILQGSRAAGLCGGLSAETALRFAVLEDADHDLGAARRLCADPGAVLGRWRDFLLWAAERPEWTLEGRLDAKAAAALLGAAEAPA